MIGMVVRDPIWLMRSVSTVAAIAWIAACFLLFRALGHDGLAAATFSLLAGASATATFWTPVPEIHMPSAVTLMLPLILVPVIEQRQRDRGWALVMASAVALSLTITNWMSGLAAAVQLEGWRRAARLTIFAFVTVSSLWVLQALWFPRDVYFLGDRSAIIPFWDGPSTLAAARVFLSHAIVMPAAALVTDPGYSAALSIQDAAIGSTGAVGLVATVSWWALLAWGAMSIGHLRTSLLTVLITTLAGQFILHALVGDETFLFAPNFTPLLIAVASIAALGRHRRAALAVAALVIVTAGLNNEVEFQRASSLLTQSTAELIATTTVHPADACR
jgi:hypothetical protein